MPKTPNPVPWPKHPANHDENCGTADGQNDDDQQRFGRDMPGRRPGRPGLVSPRNAAAPRPEVSQRA